MKHPFPSARLAWLALVTASLLLVSCGGVPLRSLPKLMQMQGELLDMNPAEFMVALQVDTRLVPPVGAVPLLVIKLQPREPGAFEPVDKKLPLALALGLILLGVVLALNALIALLRLWRDRIEGHVQRTEPLSPLVQGAAT